MAGLPPYLADDPAALARLADVDVLYTDLDGTMLARGGLLLGDSAGTPSSGTVEAIVEANRAGLTIVPVTGRNRITLTELVRLLGWSDFIGDAGGLIVRGVGTPDRTEAYNLGDWPEHMVPRGSTPLDVIDELGAYATLVAAFPGKIELHAPWHENREASHLLRGCLEVAEAQRVLDAAGIPVDVIDNGLIHPRHTLDCNGPVHAIHLVPRGVNKAQAIALDLLQRGVAAERAMAVGDSIADLQMADSVGLLAMVENAIESPVTRAALENEPRARLMRGARGEGWAELVRLWIAAKA